MDSDSSIALGKPAMRETALYFPHIRIPDRPWFTQVLLYWDKAASIVPDRERVRRRVNPYMSELHAIGLLDYVDPQIVLHGARREFDEGFLRMLGPEMELRVPSPKQYVRVHIDKVHHELVGELHGRGLIEGRDAEQQGWWRVEESTASLYMAYLASAISGARPGTLPVTDHIDTLESLEGSNDSFPKPRVEQLRYAVIRQALPVPSGRVSARELMDFKEKHAEQLLRCRIYLDGQLADLASIGDPTIRTHKGRYVLQEIEDDVARLRESMLRRKWPEVSLAGVCGVASATIATTQAFLAGGTPLTVGLAVGAGLVGLGPATLETVARIKGGQFDHSAPLAYAALAARHFG